MFRALSFERDEGMGLRHWVVAVSTPRMTTEDAPQGEVASTENAVLAEGFNRKLRAGGRVTARRWRERRYEFLVEADGQNQKGDNKAL